MWPAGMEVRLREWTCYQEGGRVTKREEVLPKARTCDQERVSETNRVDE